MPCRRSQGSVFSRGVSLLLPHTVLLVAALSTFIGCALLVGTQRWHARWTIDGFQGVQKFHTAPTPRIAGIAIYLGMWLANGVAPASVAQLLEPMLFAGIPAFAFGVLEDQTKQVGIRERLLATFASGLLAWWVTGISLDGVDVWAFDDLLAWLPISVFFTAFAICGMANAVNIIDGFNGLASGVVIIALAAMGVCAYAEGDVPLAQVCMVLGAVVAGFALVNFPMGKIFLGDGGAYFVGFCLAWVGILLAMRNPGISPWASMLACAYPVYEVLFSMLRRHCRQRSPGHADRLHMHSLIKLRVVRQRFAAVSPVWNNSAVSPLVWLMALVPAVLAVVFRHNLPGLILGFAACAGGYVLCYRRLVRFGWFR